MVFDFSHEMVYEFIERDSFQINPSNQCRIFSIPQDSFTNLNESVSLFPLSSILGVVDGSVSPLASRLAPGNSDFLIQEALSCCIRFHLTQTHKVPIYKFPNDLFHPLPYIAD
jgi:hypothetical protein